ncbi:MAG: FecR domain-containing protein, partial [Burkholderiaceae bacterium]
MRTTIARLSWALLLTSGLHSAWSAPPATSTPPSITIAPASITYITRAGDTLSSIAQQLTTKVENWVAIGKVNQISTDTNIPIGTAIVIPATLLPDEPSEAKVVALSGNIVAKTADGEPATISLGAKITEGMQIDTGNNSFLTLALPDASRISVPSNSRIKLSKLRMARYTKSPRTEINLLRGHVESQVSPLEQNKGRFEVHTPLGVAGVRGTNFRVGITENGTANEVISGNVEVGHHGKPSPLTLHAG